jgi:hypothetical protein
VLATRRQGLDAAIEEEEKKEKEEEIVTMAAYRQAQVS